MGPEYPKAIYRDGGAELIWGNPIETSAVHSAEHEAKALASGWRLHPIADQPAGSEQPKRRGRPPKVKTDGDA